MVHRDVKPSNLMLTPEGQVKLLDLGLARLQRGLSQSAGMAVERSVGVAVELPPQQTDDDMTGSGQAMGTADYMAPEQTSDSRAVDIRADIYGLGATLYKLLSGRAPFSGPEYQGTFEKMLAHRQTPPPPIRQFCPTIPEGLAAVVERMLAKDPAARYQTPTEAAEALAPFCAGSDLPALLRAAIRSAGVSPALGSESRSAGILPAPGGRDARAPAARRWRTIAAIVVALLLVGGAGFAAGIMIHIYKDGQETTVDVPGGSHSRVDASGGIHVAPSGEKPNGNTPQNADLQSEIRKVAVELAAQQALLKSVDESEVPQVEIDLLVQNDPVAKQLSTELGWKKMDQSSLEGSVKKGARNDNVTRYGKEVARLQKQYDERVKELEKKARQKKRSVIQTEIVRLQAILEALRQQEGTPQGAAAPATPAATDAKAIQGTWEIVSSTFSMVQRLPGEENVPENVSDDRVRKSTKIVITADSFRVMGQYVFNRAFEYQLNSDTKPKIIDLQDEGDVYLGIFQLTGNELRICAAYRSSETSQRPTEFWAEFGGGKELLVLRRVGDVVVSEDEKAIQGTWRVESQSLPGLLLFSHDQQVVISPRDMKFKSWCSGGISGMGSIGGSSSGVAGGGEEDPFACTEAHYALDPCCRPKAIDIAPSAASGALNAIYELQNNRLTLCFHISQGTEGSPRPTKFAADEKSGMALVVLKRVTLPDHAKAAGPKPIPSEAAAFAGFAAGARETESGPATAPMAELKALKGKWKVVRVEKGKDAGEAWDGICAWGATVGPEWGAALGPSSIYGFDIGECPFGDQNLLLTAKTDPRVSGPQQTQTQFGCRLDLTAAPKTIDIHSYDSMNQATGKLVGVGVYELKGDRLTICLARELPWVKGDQRPRGLAIRPGSGDVLFFLDRYRPSDDEKAMQGAWSIAQEIDDGKAISPKKPVEYGCWFDDQFISLMPTATSRIRSLLYTLDATKQPKTIAMSGFERDKEECYVQDEKDRYKQEDLCGIYKFEGERLTIAYRKGTKPPVQGEQFDSKPGSGVMLLVLKRPEPRKTAAPETRSGGVESQENDKPHFQPDEAKAGGSTTVTQPSPINYWTTPLAKEVRKFNFQAALDPIGKEEPLLSGDEVIAAVKTALEKPGKLGISGIADETLQALKRVVESRTLPRGFELEVLTRFIPDGKTELTKWSVRLRIPVEFDEPKGISTCIMIRDKLISSRTLSDEEQKRLKETQNSFGRTINSNEAASKPAAFRTATVTRGDVAAMVHASGTIEPDEMVDVGASVAGPIVSFGADPRGATDPQFKGKSIDYNSPVDVNTVLAKIDATAYAARVEQEEAGLRRAAAELKLAKAKGKEQTPEVAKASLEVAKATLQQCQSALALAKRNLDYTTIKSPVKGVIIDRRVNVGQNVAATGPNSSGLFLIAKDLKKMQVWAMVNEADIARIRKGMEARFTVDVFPKETFKGTVLQIRMNAAVPQNVVVYTVVIGFDNPDLKLMPYLTANVTFQVEKRSNVLRVPNAALRWKPVPDLVGSHAATPDAQGAMRSPPPGIALWIKTRDGQHVQRIPISVGLSDGLQSEVSGPDVKEGMEIVIGQKTDGNNPFVPRFFQR
jgi:HlyD family secretion protein